MNNHQNAIFHQLDNFIKHSHSFAMTIFHKITKSAKLVILLIIPTYAKVSHIDIFNGQVAFIRYSFDAIILRNFFSFSCFVFFNIIDTLKSGLNFNINNF
jgi:hypothetical protein